MSHKRLLRMQKKVCPYNYTGREVLCTNCTKKYVCQAFVDKLNKGKFFVNRNLPTTKNVEMSIDKIVSEQIKAIQERT